MRATSSRWAGGLRGWVGCGVCARGMGEAWREEGGWCLGHAWPQSDAMPQRGECASPRLTSGLSLPLPTAPPPQLH